MLSARLQYLRDYVAKGTEVGMHFEPLAVQALVAVLNECANDALALEQAVVPENLRLTGELPANVVVLEEYVETAGATRTYRFPEGNGPGGAA